METSVPGLPLVTLGVPVYNGEAHLAEALQSLLDQDYPALEILISDNASTDGTEAICRAFAARDGRIRYTRLAENLGAKCNFERLVEEARGIYFAWCAHDDLRLSRFASSCVAALERHPEAVLCNGVVEFLDEAGALRPDWEDLNFETLGMGVAQRMLRLVDHTDWVDMLGLIRTSVLRQMLPLESQWGGDVILSMRLLAQGDFLKVQEPLLRYRVRSKPKGVAVTLEEIVGRPQTCTHPYLDMLETLLRVALRALPSRPEQEAFFRAFLRVLVDTERKGPHPSWLEAVALEGGLQGRTERAPFLLVRHLLASLDSDLEVEPYLDSEVRTILLGCPKDPHTRALLPRLAQALRLKHPDASLLLLGSRSALAALPSLGEAERITLPSSLQGEALRPLIRDLGRRRIDMAIQPGPHREIPLDLCITGVRAFRCLGFRAPAPRYRWAMEGFIPKRRRVQDPNEAYTHHFPATADRMTALVSALRLS
jgi:hypothetical protein